MIVISKIKKFIGKYAGELILLSVFLLPLLLTFAIASLDKHAGEEPPALEEFFNVISGTPLDEPFYYEKGLLVEKVEQDKLLNNKYYLKYELPDQNTLVEKVSFKEYANANVGKEYHIILDYKKQNILFTDQNEDRLTEFIRSAEGEGRIIVGALSE